jgi:AcrR family transcriptional regulator
MTSKLTEQETEARRVKVLTVARWCFLNFGFTKTSLDDIARRAGISRTLLYRTFRDKEDIFTAVFAHWLLARHPAAREAAAGLGTPGERLLEVLRLMVMEPWADMVGAPMAGEFHDVCERLDPEINALHHRVARECVAQVLGNEDVADVFMLALDGLLADEPSVAVFERRVRIMSDRFVAFVDARS